MVNAHQMQFESKFLPILVPETVAKVKKVAKTHLYAQMFRINDL